MSSQTLPGRPPVNHSCHYQRVTVTQLQFNLPHKCSFQPYKGSKCGGSSPSFSESQRKQQQRAPLTRAPQQRSCLSPATNSINSGSHCASRHILIQSSQPHHEKGTNGIYTSSIREGRPPAQCRTARKGLQHRVNHSVIPKLLSAPRLNVLKFVLSPWL